MGKLVKNLITIACHELYINFVLQYSGMVYRKSRYKSHCLNFPIDDNLKVKKLANFPFH